jgi:hypothetical protein
VEAELNTPTLVLLGGVATLACVIGVGMVEVRRERQKRDADDLVRWEAEGGPAASNSQDQPQSSA